MKQEYDVNLEGIRIGRATVVPMGLYYDIQCRCKPQGDIIRIVADCGDKQENVGICVLQDGEMIIHTKLPQKRFQALRGFIAIPEAKDEWFPIVAGKPFVHLDQILHAKFCVRNGQPGLSIPQAKLHKNR